MQDVSILLCQFVICDKYFITSGILWIYYRDEVNDNVNENNDTGNYRTNNHKTTASKSFEYKTKMKVRKS